MYRSLLAASWIPVLVVIIVQSLIRRLKSRETVILSSASLLVSMSVCATVSTAVLQINRLPKGPDLRPTDSVIAEGTIGQREVGRWIKLNTPPDAIVATNHFCGSPCTGSSWFERDLDLLGDQLLPPPTETQFGGSDFFLVLYSERRYLLQAPSYLISAGVQKDELITRMRASIEFAATPGTTTLAALHSYGVTYFVADKRAMTMVDFSEVGVSVFENSEFLVIQLRSQAV